jgi:hypothetical protein
MRSLTTLRNSRCSEWCCAKKHRDSGSSIHASAARARFSDTRASSSRSLLLFLRLPRERELELELELELALADALADALAEASRMLATAALADMVVCHRCTEFLRCL